MAIKELTSPTLLVSAKRRSLLAPIAYDESAMPALRLARSSQLARAVARVVFAAMVATLLLMLFAPWQQSVKGTGNVLAYAPTARQQTVEAPIKGRIVRWGDGIFENALVKEGDLIAEIQDLDPELSNRLEGQVTVMQQAVAAARQQLAANQGSLEFARRVIDSNLAQVQAYRVVQTQTVAAAQAYVQMATEKVAAEKQQLQEFQAALAQVHADYIRQKQLYEENIVSQLKYQEAERKYKEAQAKVAKTEAYVSVAENELEGKQSELEAKRQKAQVDIDYALAMLGKAEGDVKKAESDVAKASAELSKIQKELVDVEVKEAQQRSRKVTAPVDGIIVQIVPNQGGQMLKEGDTLCTIVPETADRAVQLWMDGNDAPLIEPGRQVRLQFEGWPAIQFAGWPSVAVGTFGGTVISVDATDNGKGQFRVLVLPDDQDREWPAGRFLRQGVRANGWVMLDRVSLWFEVWRNLNGFPPVVSIDEPLQKLDKTPAKLSKGR